MNPREGVWKELYSKIMKITLRKGIQFRKSLQLGPQICSYAASEENSGCESGSGQGMEEARKIQPGSWTK